MNLLTEEKNELHVRPIGTSFFTEEQILVRQAIAKKICHHFMEVDTSLTLESREVYNKVPMWKFYMAGNVMKRVYGVCLCQVSNDKNEYRAHTVTAMSGFLNKTVGGTPISELVVLETWPEEQLIILKSGFIPDAFIFLDPLGFIAMFN